jgi:hypothetical protein
MATYRKLHTTFWTDPFVEKLTQEQKLFYVYLITNTKTKQSGIYEISKSYMRYETGFSLEQITELITHFIKLDKIVYSKSTDEIGIKNFLKHNFSYSHSVLQCILTDLSEVKNKTLIAELYTKDYVVELNKAPDIKKKDGTIISGIYTPLVEYLQSIYTMYTLPTQSVDTMYTLPIQQEQEQEQEEEQTQEQKEIQEQEQTQEQKEIQVITKVKKEKIIKLIEELHNADRPSDIENILNDLDDTGWEYIYSVLEATEDMKKKLKQLVLNKVIILQTD